MVLGFFGAFLFLLGVVYFHRPMGWVTLAGVIMLVIAAQKLVQYIQARKTLRKARQQTAPPDRR
jgi:hypothetical protein